MSVEVLQFVEMVRETYCARLRCLDNVGYINVGGKCEKCGSSDLRLVRSHGPDEALVCGKCGWEKPPSIPPEGWEREMGR